VWLYHNVVKPCTNWVGKNAFFFNNPLGAEGSSPKHHCGSQQTLCLVPSLGCPLRW
jgi:hypothetical protein